MKNCQLRFATMTTNVGTVLAVSTDRGLCALRFSEDGSQPDALRALLRQHQATELVEDREGMKPLLKLVEKALGGRIPASEVPLDPAGTPFQKRVWRELVKVPWGQTVSYSDLARKAGKPLAVRAVASACARNPITFIVPCHRVLRKNGDLGGYFWGLSKKELLLERERLPL